MKRRTHTQLPDATINLTSLLDITFVLLIAFMIVAPAVKYNVDLELPKVAQGQTSDARKPVTIQVTYDAKASRSTCYVNGRSVVLDRVAETVKSLEPNYRKAVIALEGDRDVPWEEMTRLMTLLTNAEILNLSIVTEKGAGS